MKDGRALVFLVIIASVACTDVGQPSDGPNQKGESVAALASDAQVRANEMGQICAEALRGDGQAARRLAVHYEIAAPNREAARHWWQIAAENGDVSGMINVAISLRDSGTVESRTRAIFWLERARSAAKDVDQGKLPYIERLLQKYRLESNRPRT